MGARKKSKMMIRMTSIMGGEKEEKPSKPGDSTKNNEITGVGS